MTDQPVTPDREALIDRAGQFFRMDIARGLVLDSDMDRLVDALWPLLTEALDRARQQGKREGRAAEREENERAIRDECHGCQLFGEVESR